jgi:hypothetical protein
LQKWNDQEQEQSQSKDCKLEGLPCDAPQIGGLVNCFPPLPACEYQADHKQNRPTQIKCEECQPDYPGGQIMAKSFIKRHNSFFVAEFRLARRFRLRPHSKFLAPDSLTLYSSDFLLNLSAVCAVGDASTTFVWYMFLEG